MGASKKGTAIPTGGAGLVIGKVSKAGLQDLVVYLLRQRAGDENLSGQALAETFCDAYEPVAALRGERAPGTWILQKAERDAAARKARQEQHRQEVERRLVLLRPGVRVEVTRGHAAGRRGVVEGVIPDQGTVRLELDPDRTSLVGGDFYILDVELEGAPR
jgi:hypothetical protein